MKMFIIRGADPLDHEGSADVFGVFADKALADETVEKLKVQEEADKRKHWGERWRSFAVYFEVETHEVILTSEQADEEFRFSGDSEAAQ
jgi:hypothetical protein